MWLSVWTRAVVSPAARRSAGVWVGSAMVAAVVFGPTGMQPRDLTGLSLHVPAAGLVLATIWLLVFLPIARDLVRADGARYLRSLPGPRLSPILVGGSALVLLQGPWLALWLIGEGPRGLLLVLGHTALMTLLAAWRPPVLRPRTPTWRSSRSALVGVHLRALRRRAGDALLRGVGLAILAGGLGGLFVGNNRLAGASAATVGISAVAAALVPAQVGPLLVLADSHRRSAWLRATLGISPASSITALAFVVILVHVSASLVALATLVLVASPDPETTAIASLAAITTAVGTALVETRALLGTDDAITSRIVSGAVASAALTIVCLTALGVPGALAVLASGALALATVHA